MTKRIIKFCLNFDDLTCFLCKQSGHIASQCKNIPNPISEEDQPSQNSSLEGILDPKVQSKKRPADSETSDPSTSITAQMHTDELQATKFKRPEERAKRKKASQEKRSDSLQRYDSTDSILPSTVSERLECVKSLFDNDNNHYVLNFIQFCDFMTNVSGNSDPLSVSKDYTNDIRGLLNMLYDLYPTLDNRSMKNRFTRIQKRLKSQLGLSAESFKTDDDSDSSSQQSLF